MASSRLDINSYIGDLAEIKREMEAEKTRQFIGSNQISMKISETASQWDVSLMPTYTGQSAGGARWNACVVTARAANSDNLVADLAVEFDRSMPIHPAIVEFPLPPAQSQIKKWIIPIFGQPGQPVRLKFQVIANDDVNISWEEWRS